VKRTQRSSNSPAMPTVRALPPRRRRLADTPGFRPALRIAGGVAIALLILGGAFGAVIALDRGMLPPIAIPLASLSVLAATAAYLAGRAEGRQDNATSAGRTKAKGRLQKGATAKSARAGANDCAAQATTADGNSASITQSGSAALQTKFLDDISQALRAPITSICLAARIIRKHYDSTPEVVAHFGDTLLAEADRLGQTVDEFLELARLESGLIQWHEDEVDAADLIQRAVAEVEPVAVSYGVSVAFTMEPALPPLHVDLERVTQALTILLAMSVRAATEGSEVVIQIAGAHGGWVFTVGGTSFVYPHSEARKVNARTDGAGSVEPIDSQPDGVGLGLCLCREIVTRYQGRFWIEGQPGASGCARFTIPYRQHRRATAAPTAATGAGSTQAERPPATASPAAAANAAPPTPADLEQRREAAVKALRERAAAQPSVADGDTVVTAEAKDTKHESTDVEAESPKPSAPSAAEMTSTSTTSTEPARGADATAPAPCAEEPAATPTSDEPVSPTRPGAKISFARRRATAAPTTPAPSTVVPTTPLSPTAVDAPPTAQLSEAPASEADVAAEISEPEVEIEIDDAPVHAPVSGTMITATHRTAGPPVLAHPGVPALRGVQSAASAAMQGSDELLLEIAEAQSPDGRALVVSEEVRSLLASAPGTLPAVAAQSAPAVAGRGAYTPSRRRMVQAPWVVRPGSEGQTTANETPADTTQAQPDAAAGGQRPRLNERLAKRLGLTGSSQPGRTGGAAGGPGANAYLRSRRLGSR
jgi:signal transduction histidine kinase